MRAQYRLKGQKNGAAFPVARITPPLYPAMPHAPHARSKPAPMTSRALSFPGNGRTLAVVFLCAT